MNYHCDEVNATKCRATKCTSCADIAHCPYIMSRLCGITVTQYHPYMIPFIYGYTTIVLSLLYYMRNFASFTCIISVFCPCSFSSILLYNVMLYV